MERLCSIDHGPPSQHQQQARPVCSCSVLNQGNGPPSTGHQLWLETSLVNKTSFNSVKGELEKIDCFVLSPSIFALVIFVSL